jgi:hypothetical protein
MGYASFREVKERFEFCISAGDLIERQTRSPGRAFTTDHMIALERDTIRVMRAGQDHYEPLVSSETRREIEQKHFNIRSNFDL